MEYGHVPGDIYGPKRREILEGFLARERIYLTDWAHERWDGQARSNLTEAIDALRETS
jgi:predicted metal-dependent HD superfamily phosphohydrolase